MLAVLYLNWHWDHFESMPDYCYVYPIGNIIAVNDVAVKIEILEQQEKKNKIAGKLNQSVGSN